MITAIAIFFCASSILNLYLSYRAYINMQDYDILNNELEITYKKMDELKDEMITTLFKNSSSELIRYLRHVKSGNRCYMN